MTVDEIGQVIRAQGLQQDVALGIAINSAILDMSEDDIKRVAQILGSIYPGNEFAGEFKKVNHIATSVVLRTLFGSLTRNGLVLDYTHPDRTVDFAHNLSIAQTSWEKPFYFMQCLEQYFKERGNNYGLTILYEMLGHRYGDLAVVSSDDTRRRYIELMEKAYCNSFEEADKIKCMKQLFSPWYWGAVYFTKLGINDKALEWHKKYQEAAKQYMFDGRSSYTNKTILSLNMLKKLMSKHEWKVYVRYLKKTSQNPHYSKTFTKGGF